MNRKKTFFLLTTGLLIFITLLISEVLSPDVRRGLHLIRLYLYVGAIVSFIFGIIALALSKKDK